MRLSRSVPTATPSFSTTAPGCRSRSNVKLPPNEFPSAEELWQRCCAWKNQKAPLVPIGAQDFYDGGPDKEPHYHLETAIILTVEAIAKGVPRVLIVMATGTVKTFVAFQVIWHL